jgi:hypothetical protein
MLKYVTIALIKVKIVTFLLNYKEVCDEKNT